MIQVQRLSLVEQSQPSVKLVGKLVGDLLWRLGEAMRYAVRYSSCTLLSLVAATTLSAQETKAPWWHFGRDQTSPTPAASVTPAPTMTPAPETITPIEEDSWFAWPSKPKWHWPEFGSDTDAAVTDLPASETPAATSSRPRFARSPFGKPIHQSRPRNTWAQQPASTETATGASTWDSMKSGTRNAWHKTVDFVTPGESIETTAPVKSETHSSWWQRMWGSEQSQEGPQTVTEWMAQDRIDP